MEPLLAPLLELVLEPLLELLLVLLLESLLRLDAAVVCLLLPHPKFHTINVLCVVSALSDSMQSLCQ